MIKQNDTFNIQLVYLFSYGLNVIYAKPSEAYKDL